MTNPNDQPRPPTRRPQPRCEATRKRMLDGLRDHMVATGRYQLPLKELLHAAGVKHDSMIARYFGGTRLAHSCVARHDPERIVASLGLSTEAFSKLTARDVKSIATAVLAGRRAEHP